MTAKRAPAKSAAKLPAPAAGVIVKIDLELWPDYARIHRLEVIGGDKKTVTVIVRVAKEGVSHD